MAIQSRNKVSAEFSMSSMTDIVFLLLIFFIIASTMISPYGIKVLLPQSAQRTTGKQNISVSITEDLKFYVGDKQVQKSEIESILRREVGSEEKPGVILRAHEDVNVKNIVYVMDIAKRNKYQVVLATRNQ